jgi:hypothetical protein
VEVNMMIQRPNDNCEAFDQAIAIWYWCTHWYSKFDAKHEAFCRIESEYKLRNIPSIDFDSEEYDEDEGVRFVYHELTEDNWEQVFENWCDYMDNEWDNN